MKPIRVPSKYDYIIAFLTFNCGLGCSYCINKHSDLVRCEEMSIENWISGLGRIETRPDLPITLGGGEPTMARAFYPLVRELNRKNKHLDLLTNGMFPLDVFTRHIDSNIFKRGAKYTSIRVSFHAEQHHAMALALKVWTLRNLGYEAMITAIDAPMEYIRMKNDDMKMICKQLNLPYVEKQFLGWHEGKMYGEMKYPKAVGQKETTDVLCKQNQLLINPAGYIFRCHADLYGFRNSIGHILDDEVRFPDYLPCEHYGQCNPCDIRVKYDRFQNKGYCSVSIKEQKGGDNERL